MVCICFKEDDNAVDDLQLVEWIECENVECGLIIIVHLPNAMTSVAEIIILHFINLSDSIINKLYSKIHNNNYGLK